MAKQILYTINVQTGQPVKSIGELKQVIKDLRKELEKPLDADTYAKVEKQIRAANVELKNFNRSLHEGKSFSEKITGSISEGFKGVGAAIVGAFAVEKVIEFGAESFKAFNEAELNATRLKTAVGVNGGLASDFEKLKEQSEELQKTTIFSDDAIQQVQTAALQFGLTRSQVEKLIPTLTDFASATGNDLKSSLDAVLRGIEGSGKGLKLYGIEIDSTKSKAELLADITDKLNAKFLGQSEIVGNTAAGNIKKLGNSFDELKEDVGKAETAIAEFFGDVYLYNFDKVKFYQNKAYEGAAKAQEDESKKNEKYLETYHKNIESLTLSQLQNLEKKKTDIQKSGTDSRKRETQLELQAIRSLITEKNLLYEQENSNKDELNKKATEQNAKRLAAIKQAAQDEISAAQQRADTKSLQGSTPEQRNQNEINAQNELLQFYKDNGTRLVQAKGITQAELENVVAKSNDKIVQLQKAGYQIEVKNLDEHNQTLINATVAGTQDRIQALIDAKQEELKLLKSAPGLSDDARLNQERKLQNDIIEIKKKGIEQTSAIQNTGLEAEKVKLKSEYDAVFDNENKKRELKLQIEQVEKQEQLNSIDSQIESLNLLRDANNNLYGQDLANYKLLLEQKQALTDGYTQTQIEINTQQAEMQKQALSQLLDAYGSFFIGLSQLANQASQIQTQEQLERIDENLSAEIEALDIAQAKEEGTYVEKTATQKKFDNERKRAREKAAAEEKKLKHDQAVADKTAAVIASIINTAVAVTKLLATPPLAFAAGVAGALETSLIAASPVPYEFGGLIRGKKHSQGGIPAIVDGQTPIELEGDEIILNKNVSRNPALRQIASELNSSTGGVSFAPPSTTLRRQFTLMEMGGEISRFAYTNSSLGGATRYAYDSSGLGNNSSNVNVTNSVDFAELKSFLDAKLSQPIRSYVLEKDMTNAQTLNRTLERRASFEE